MEKEHKFERDHLSEKTTFRERFDRSRLVSPLHAFMECGFDYDYIYTLTLNSNDYMSKKISETKRRKPFKEITIEEMYRFHGILLRISLMPMDCGGYKAYFNPVNRRICYKSSEDPVELVGSHGFVTDGIMTLSRFEEIRSAYHPQRREFRNPDDKCFHVRYVLFNDSMYN